MKRIIIAALIGVASISSVNYAAAQVNVNLNIGSQPLWGPTGYDHVDYYYLPEIDSYYDVPTNQYVYLSNGKWIRRESLPAQYGNFDLYRTYKVVINGNKPYLQHREHVVKYKNYKSSYNKQTPIRDSRDSKYRVNARPARDNGNQHNSGKGNAGKNNRSDKKDNNGRGKRNR
jgi:hypothetical protein